MCEHTDDIIWAIISLKLAGEANQQELDKLQAAIDNDAVWKTRLQLLELWWNNEFVETEPSFATFFEKLRRKLDEI